MHYKAWALIPDHHKTNKKSYGTTLFLYNFVIFVSDDFGSFVKYIVFPIEHKNNNKF